MFKRDLANHVFNASGVIERRGSDASKEYVFEKIIAEEFIKKHNEGELWIHDLAFYDSTYNCLGVSLKSILSEGFHGKGFYIDRSRNLKEALRNTIRFVNLLTNEQSGGIGFINFDADIAKVIKEESDYIIGEEIRQFLIDLNMQTRRGCEVPYVTLNIGIDRDKNAKRVARILLQEFEKGFDESTPFIFPNVVFKVAKKINREKGSPNYDIFCKALETTAKCMNPTYLNCNSKLNEGCNLEELGIMGCRTRVYDNHNGKEGAVKRGNIACVSLNLPNIALSSGGDLHRFYKKLKSALCDGKEILLDRYDYLCKKDIGDFEFILKNRLYEGDDVVETRNFLKNGTLSIGFIGLFEALKILKKSSYNDLLLEEGSELGIEIVEFMHGEIEKFSKEYKLNFSLLASSGEGISGAFPVKDLKSFGVREGINDKGFYTNSFHVPVNIPIHYLKKFNYEGRFHRYCKGGSISYVEFGEIPFENIEAIEEVVNYGMDCDCNYIGINFPLDICNNCGCKGSFNESCTGCGSKNIKKIRRVSGYLSYHENFASGKKKELENRVEHI